MAEDLFRPRRRRPQRKVAERQHGPALGLRGLPGGDSLARLLERERGVRNILALPMLTEEKICRWAAAHCRQTEGWPNENSGPVQAAPGETWGNVNAALRDGLRGLPGGETLAQLLARRLGVRNRTRRRC